MITHVLPLFMKHSVDKTCLQCFDTVS